MSGLGWITVATAMGIACLCVSRWWVRLMDVREPKYVGLLKEMP